MGSAAARCAESAKLKDVFGLSFDSAGRLFVGHKQGVSIFDAKGALVRTVSSDQPSTFFLDERGRIVTARHGALVTEGGGEMTTLQVLTPNSGGKARDLDDLPSIGILRNGDRLVADREGKAVARFSPAGKYLDTFAQVNPEQLAVSGMEDVAIINRDTKSIVVVDRDGKTLSTIPAKTTAYQLSNPSDVAFDPLGHLYVLDRGKPSVLIFGAKGALISTLSIPDKSAGAFQKPLALAVDDAGRIFVFDDRAGRVQVYQ